MASVCRKLAVLAIACAALGAQALPPQTATDNRAVQSEAPGNLVPPQIVTLRIQWTTFLQTKQLDKLMPLYSRNAMFLDSTGQRLIGSQAIRKLFGGVLSTFNLNLNLYPLMTEMSGDLAYESGNYLETLTQASTGVSEDIHGTYIMLFKHQPDGTWKIIEQMWTQAPRAPQQKP